MKRNAPSKWPAPIALIFAAAGAVLGWILVRAEVSAWESQGFTAGPEMGMVVFLAVAGAVSAYYISRRILDGPALTRTGWSVSFSGPALATVGDLLHALKSRGYSITAVEIDDAAEPLSAAAPERPLGGAQIALSANQAARARVVIRLSKPDSAGAPGLGLIESEDTAAGFYDELAQYVIAALARLVPGIAYKGADSAIDSEPAESLEKLLPARPSRLDGNRRSIT